MYIITYHNLNKITYIKYISNYILKIGMQLIKNMNCIYSNLVYTNNFIIVAISLFIINANFCSVYRCLHYILNNYIKI